MTESEIEQAYMLVKRIKWLKECIQKLKCVKGDSNRYLSLSVHRKDRPTISEYTPEVIRGFADHEKLNIDLMIKVFQEELKQLEQQMNEL